MKGTGSAECHKRQERRVFQRWEWSVCPGPIRQTEMAVGSGRTGVLVVLTDRDGQGERLSLIHLS